MLVKMNELVFLPSKTEDNVLIKELGFAILKASGCTIDKITSLLPQTNISAAEKEIKAFQPQNKALQNLKCCPVLGGRVQVLI